MTADPDPRQAEKVGNLVGARLRGLRRMQGSTLQDVAGRAGISHSFLSMLERGRADVSLQRLSRLADVFGVELSELLVDASNGPEPVIVSQEDMLFVDRGPGITYRFLPTSKLSGPQLIHVRFEPGAGFRDRLTHRGEDFCWIVRGEVVLVYGDQEHRIPAGSAVAYPATIPHAFRNDGRRVAELVAMTSPAYW